MNTTTNQYITMPIFDLTEDNIHKKIQENLSLNDIYNGQKSLAKFTVNHLLTDDDGKLKYICSDPSRQIFKFKDKDGRVVKDVRANKLTKLISDPVSKISYDIYINENKDVQDNIFTSVTNITMMYKDTTDFRSELVSLTTMN